jgi:hypothetical protein
MDEQTLKDCEIIAYSRSEKAREWAKVASTHEWSKAEKSMDKEYVQTLEDKYVGNNEVVRYVAAIERMKESIL